MPHPEFIQLQFRPHDQTDKQVMEALGYLLRRVGCPACGRIAFLDNAVDQTTGTIKVRAIFDNSDASLWPGQFYTVNVKLYDQENAIVVPSRALQTGPNGQFVYVVKADMTAEVRKVVVSRTEGENSVLAEGGVAKGEQVVVRGALRLAPGAKVSINEGAPS